MIEIGLIVLSFAFSSILSLETLWVALGSIAPLNFPFFESAIISSAVSFVLSKILDKRKGVSFFVGWFLGELLLSFARPVMAFYPFANRFGFSQAGEAGLALLASIIGASLLASSRKIRDYLMGINPTRIRAFFFFSAILFLVLLPFFEKTYVPICDLKNSPELYSEKYVLTQGRVCSSIQSRYGYDVFYLCDECNISVWSKSGFPSPGELHEVFGVFSMRYQEPEIIVK